MSRRDANGTPGGLLGFGVRPRAFGTAAGGGRVGQLGQPLAYRPSSSGSGSLSSHCVGVNPIARSRMVGQQLEARPLELGRSDGRVVEVLSGLSAGERYAAKNSFVIKAELGKAGASHDH